MDTSYGRDWTHPVRTPDTSQECYIKLLWDRIQLLEQSVRLLQAELSEIKKGTLMGGKLPPATCVDHNA